MEQKESIELYKWRCPECRDGVCQIVGLADDFREEVAGLRDDLMLDPIELNILSTLNEEDSAMRAGEIGALIDATHQMVGRRTSKLRDLKLVSKQSSAEDGAMRSRITPEAKSVYFADES
ncbi:regulatory protein MarR [Rhodanobacter fulvus Jip2]|uniref:Regulatory protein MarR n=1 Tax=Rhodanobacter fulvus Jip2 TaxID=1163408 RepID=I4VNE3_9GAMM|nr:regulatory protein MarR [Rhodanobacter fulvus Jip2]